MYLRVCVEGKATNVTFSIGENSQFSRQQYMFAILRMLHLRSELIAHYKAPPGVIL